MPSDLFHTLVLFTKAVVYLFFRLCKQLIRLFNALCEQMFTMAWQYVMG